MEILISETLDDSMSMDVHAAVPTPPSAAVAADRLQLPAIIVLSRPQRRLRDLARGSVPTAGFAARGLT